MRSLRSLTRVLVLAGAVTLANALGSVTGQTNHLFAAEAGKAPVNYALTANNDFALDLYKQLSKENRGKTLFFSPYSVFSALAMAVEGARGTTAEEMGKVLCFPTDVRNLKDAAQLIPWRTAMIHTGMAALNERLNARNQPYELRVANALWGEQSHPFLPAYVRMIHKCYRTGGLFPVDFHGNPEAARHQINAWVEEQTAQKIKDLVPQGAITDLTRMVLTNAIYFKGDWDSQFKKDQTREGDFMVSATEKVKAPLMRKSDIYQYADDGSVQVLELPYKGRELSMLVLLPKGAGGLPKLEKSLTGKKLGDLRSKLQSELVDAAVPKFNLETAYGLEDTLKALGMKAAFLQGTANFSGIDGLDDLSLSAVIHKAFVEVNEQGTEAAAATATMMLGGSAAPVKPIQFRADHPFVFIICDRQDGTILFLGRMMNPTSTAP